MKSTGITRKVDDLGRITIPKEIRSQFKIYEQDPLEIFVDGEKIILKKYAENCIFCNSKKVQAKIEGQLVCDKCIEKISKLTK